MPVLTDDRWVANHLERWRVARDPDAFGELLKWQRDRAFAIACRVLNDRAEAEDAVQQAFLKLFRSAPAFDGPSAFHAALYRSVTQCAIDLARTKHARRVMEHAMAQQGRSTVPASPVEATEQREAVRILQQEMQTLGPEDRALLALCCQEGVSLVAAAETLSMPRESARDRLARLLNDLRSRLAKRGVALSLLLLIALFQQGRALSASESLCLALDGALPGATCAGLAPAAAASVSASAILAQAGLSAGLLAGKALIGASVAAVVCAGAVTWIAFSSPSPEPSAPPVPPTVVAPRGERVVPAESTVVNSAPAAPAVAEPPPAPEPREQKKKDHDDDDDIPLGEVPANVRAAAEAAVPGIEFIHIERETKDDKIIYNFEGRAAGKLWDIEVDQEARGVKVEEKDEKEKKDKKDQDKRDRGVPPPAEPKPTTAAEF